MTVLKVRRDSRVMNSLKSCVSSSPTHNKVLIHQLNHLEFEYYVMTSHLGLTCIENFSIFFNNNILPT